MKGRGTSRNTPNKFEQLHLEPFDVDVAYDGDTPPVRTTFYDDASRTVLAKNDSPDIPFTYSINPYRGCEHGCAYCYARPSHEYLGFSAGLDFESKIMVKRRAPELLAEALQRRQWVPQTVAMSGNTDCYQPVERSLQLTRRCLEVFAEFRNPVTLITKNALVVRDVDILGTLSRSNAVRVAVSIITLDSALARRLEPRTSSPANRLKAIEELAAHGIPVGVNIAPVIPGLTDVEIPDILKEAAARGATLAAFSTVRLPGAVEAIFTEWLQREMPDRAARVLNRIREIHGGNLNDARFGSRLEGTGETARVLHELFSLNATRYGFPESWPELSTQDFRRRPSSQADLFESAPDL